jgi:acyl-coenzyme A synthetase/AMP-(fatty) acid ligase
VGSPPLAFTFGLGGLAVFPLRFGAAAVLLENASPPNLIDIIERYGATVCFTAPTAYRAMLAAMEEGADLSSLRAAVSAGETLPAPVYEDWIAKTGKPMLDGIGATEMLHIFISNRFDDHKPACTGKPVTGYEAKVIGEDGAELPAGEVGRLAVRGPTGCRYLADPRQTEYVQDGWNITGDAFWHGRGRLFPLCRAERRHDPVLGLQHRRARGGGRASLASRRGGMRRHRRAGPGPRADRRSACGPRRRGGALGRDGQRSCRTT